MTAKHDERVAWTETVALRRLLYALRPVLLGAAAACAVVLTVLLLFSLGESSTAGLWFSIKFAFVLLAVIWLMLTVGAYAVCGRIELEYVLDGGTITIAECGRKTRVRTIPLTEVRRMRRICGGVRLTAAQTHMYVFCTPDVRGQIERRIAAVRA